MNTLELQNSRIRKILDLKDTELLMYFQPILENVKCDSVYQLSETEHQILNESKADFDAGKIYSHEDVMREIEKIWLNQ